MSLRLGVRFEWKLTVQSGPTHSLNSSGGEEGIELLHLQLRQEHSNSMLNVPYSLGKHGRVLPNSCQRILKKRMLKRSFERSRLKPGRRAGESLPKAL